MNYVDNELEEWLNHNDLGLSIVRKKYLATIGSDEDGNPVQETFSQWMDRISNGNADIRKLLVEKKFLFGGRILSNRKIIDNGIKSTLSNCYVLSVDDNIESIYKCCSDMARTYSYGGGVGIDISKLRPRGAVVHNSAKTTSGAVSFMKTFDVVTGTIGQSGRRGALMISLDIRHPDIEEFIDIKANTTEITNANISVRVNDEFMSAVENDKDYVLRYPCETALSETITESLPYGEVKYEDGIYLKKVKAKELFMKIAKNNWDYGEPGVLYWDRICNYNLMSENPNFKYAGVNPCAEEPLPDGGACLLGSMNLKCYVKDNGEFDYDEFGKDVRIATTALNEVQQEGIELHPLPIQKQTASQFRQIGLGIFDLAGALIKMKVRYGSEVSCKVAYDITHTMLLEAFKQSCNLNTEGVVYEGMFDSEMYKKQIKPYLPPEYINRYPLNSQILTIAPTGTLSTMVNATSGGGEPMFATYYTRTTKSLYGKDVTFKVYPQCILDFYNGEPETLDDLPDYFITADKLDWRERVKMQGTLQKNIDASISSTVNLKESSTIEDVFNIYLTAWKEGLKGITIFRDNCKRVAILSKPVQEIEPLTEFKTTTAPKRPKALEADFYQIKAMGEDFRVFVGLYESRPYEIFAMPCESCDKLPSHKGQIIKTKKRTYRFVSDLADIENIALNEEGDRIYRNVTLHVSGALRHGMPIKSIISLEEKCNDNIISFNKAISRVLAKYLPKDTITDDTCPECGNKLVFENGCKHCPSCGYSQCG